MAQYSQASTQDSLLRVYDRSKLFEPCERLETRFWDDIKEADDVAPRGSAFYFRVIGGLGYGVGNPADGGSFSTARTREEVQCYVNEARIDSVVQVTQSFLDASKDDGSFSGDAEAEVIIEAAKQLYYYADALMGATFGDGALAEVEGTVDTSATVTLAWPSGAYNLRKNMTIDIVESTGTAAVSAGVIDSINYRTPSIVLTATVNIPSDGAKVYMTGQYGLTFPNGLLNIVDDGDLASTIFGVTRANAPYLNAIEDSGSGSLDDLEEDALDRFLDTIGYGASDHPTELRSNAGMAAAFKKLLTKDRVFQISGRGVIGGVGGANQEELAFVHNSVKMPWKVDRNLPARQVFALHKPSFRKHTLHKADWFRYKDGSIFHLVPNTTTYKYAFIGSMYMGMNLSARKLNVHGVRKNFKDPNVGNSGDA